MRLLINLSPDDRTNRASLIPILKQHGLTGIASEKVYDIAGLLNQAQQSRVDAILLTNPDTLKQLLGEKATLDNYRGTRINYSTPVIVANPLEHIFTIPYGKWLLESDLRKFRRIREPVQPFSFTVVDNEDTRKEAKNFLRDTCLISYDIETDEKRQITCISFTCLSVRGSIAIFVVPLVDFGVLHYTELVEFQASLEFIQYVCKTDIPKIAFNALYDSSYLVTYHADVRNIVCDVMILAWSLYCELPRSLDFQCSVYLYDFFQWKVEADTAKKNKDIKAYWAYCAKDSLNTFRLFLALLKNLENYQIFNYKEAFPQIYPDMYCAFEGFAIDNKRRIEIREDRLKRQESLLKDLRTMSCNPTFNPQSPDQVSHFIYNVIGAKKLDKYGKVIKGEEATKVKGGTGFKVLNRVSMQHPLLARIGDMIIEYRENTKAISTYCDFEQLNNRLYYSIDSTGAETFRKASKASSFYCGTQIQNMPPYAKEFLVFDEGFEGFEADKNKSEARCVAYSSQALSLIEALEDHDKDFYKVMSTRFFGIPYEEVSDELRNDVTKHIIHGTHHVMGHNPFIDTATPRRLFNAMKMVNTPLRSIESFVKYLLSLYHKASPEVKKYWAEEVFQVVRDTHKTVSHLGWTRYYFGDIRKNHAIFRGAVAHQSQNLSVHIINREYLQVYKQLVLPSNGDFRLKAQIHDSIVGQWRIGMRDKYLPEVKRIMGTEVKIHGRVMKIPVDVKLGEGSWAKLQKIKT